MGVYDAAHDAFLIFGGYEPYQYDNDVWSYDLKTGAGWTQLTPAGTPPSPRMLAVAVYDAGTPRLVVSGGIAASDNTVYALSLGTTPTWSQLVAPWFGNPAARDDYAAAYDSARRRFLMFGGERSTNFSATLTADVWALDMTGTPVAWTQLAKTGGAPYWRRDAAAAYDPVRDQMLVFGGYGTYRCGPGDYCDLYFNDVYALPVGSTGTWQPLSPAGPFPDPRQAAAMIYDPAGDRLVLFGGSIKDAHGNYHYGNDVWVLPLAGPPQWTQLTPTGTPPHTRGWSPAVYDPAGGRMILFGGSDGSGVLYNDVWSLTLGTTPTWTQLFPGGGPPPPRFNTTAVLDEIRHRIVVFGGYGYGTPVPYLLNDTWALDLSGPGLWTQLAPSGALPATRSGMKAVFDPAAARLVLVDGWGGNGTGGYDYDDIWALTFDQPVAVRVSPGLASVSTVGVTVRWSIPQSLPTPLRLWRHVQGRDWEALAATPIARDGHVEARDPTPARGTTSTYALAWGAGERGGDTDVVVPASDGGVTVAVRQASARGVAAELWLPAAGAVDLDVFALDGRCLAHRAATELASGHHEIPIPFQAAAGMYILRARQDGAETRRTFLVMP